jgi:hypothetical protein
MIKNGTSGIQQYSGKFKELCKPCMQAKQRAENHGHEHQRHPDGKPGEHLHSDLAVLSTPDLNGNKYVLTVMDEISNEIIVALLKRKTAEEVCRICRIIQQIISARTGNKLLTWQFDRGSEFLNSNFEKWLKLELGRSKTKVQQCRASLGEWKGGTIFPILIHIIQVIAKTCRPTR